MQRLGDGRHTPPRTIEENSRENSRVLDGEEIGQAINRDAIDPQISSSSEGQ